MSDLQVFSHEMGIVLPSVIEVEPEVSIATRDVGTVYCERWLERDVLLISEVLLTRRVTS